MAKLENLGSLSRAELLLLCRMAEQSERYEEMIEFVRAFISKDHSELSVEERNILSVAYKNVVGNRRTAWRVLNSIEQKETRRNNEENKTGSRHFNYTTIRDLFIWTGKCIEEKN